jgi:hypothetical protein
MTVYIEIQRTDHHEYPIGPPTRIGPFTSNDDAEEFMENSKRFTKMNAYGYVYWRMNQYGNHLVSIRDLTFGLQDPSRYA